MNIVLKDEELVALVEAEVRAKETTIDDWMEALVRKELNQRKPQTTHQEDEDEGIRQTMHKIYNIARRYWVSVGEMERANLSDEYLAEHFGAFDENGIPRFKDELSEEPPVGSLAYAGTMAQKANIRTNTPFDSSQSDDILNEELANDILKNMKDLVHG